MAGSPYTVTIRTELQEELSRFMPVRAAVDHSNELRTPMPGKVHSVAVEEGEEVIAGQELCVIEAMKMQNVLRAAKDAVVDKVPPRPAPRPGRRGGHVTRVRGAAGALQGRRQLEPQRPDGHLQGAAERPLKRAPSRATLRV
jgi:hypothetical protein